MEKLFFELFAKFPLVASSFFIGGMSGFYFTPAIKERFNLSTDISDAEGRAWLLKTLTHKSAESYLKYSTASIQPNQKLGHRMGCLALLTASKRRMEVAGVPVYAVFYRDQVDIVDVPTYEQCLVNWRIVENELATEEYKVNKNKINRVWDFLHSKELYDFLFTELNRPIALEKAKDYKFRTDAVKEFQLAKYQKIKELINLV
mmetsp:Transcript_24357/g.26628  ORF Transcript_24357/g.26628 Transcript_24357/m.26628 type:complete len:203 (+) Transcript_24357:39-647(+)